MSNSAKENGGMLGRVLMTISVLMYGAVPPFVDITQTHLLNPEWPPHARLHMSWLLMTNGSIGLLCLCLLWMSGDRASSRIGLAGILGTCVLGGFFVSAATMPFYGGSLTDPGGVVPVNGVDGNLVAFGLAFVLLVLGWMLALRGRSETRP